MGWPHYLYGRPALLPRVPSRKSLPGPTPESQVASSSPVRVPSRNFLPGTRTESQSSSFRVRPTIGRPPFPVSLERPPCAVPISSSGPGGWLSVAVRLSCGRHSRSLSIGRRARSLSRAAARLSRSVSRAAAFPGLCRSAAVRGPSSSRPGGCRRLPRSRSASSGRLPRSLSRAAGLSVVRLP